MKTMVPEPYVNHVSTMTGGSGFGALEHFYRNNFVTRSPPDTELLPVSRTVGSDRIVDEMVFRCTHTCEIDYFLPGIEPTGKRLEIPMVGIVNFRGDKLSFESLYWDQASALAQSKQIMHRMAYINAGLTALSVLLILAQSASSTRARYRLSQAIKWSRRVSVSVLRQTPTPGPCP